MAKKTENNYFLMMKEAAVCANEAAVMLNKILHNHNPATLADMKSEIHVIENRGDALRRSLVEKLVKEFITPIERDDIMALADQLDDVIDGVEEVVLKMYMYNVKNIRPEALEFADLVEQSTASLITVFDEFENFRKSKDLKDAIIEINRLEEVGDALYTKSIRRLYENGADIMDVIAWTEIFNCLESACDVCEHTADLVELVILRNT